MGVAKLFVTTLSCFIRPLNQPPLPVGRGLKNAITQNPYQTALVREVQGGSGAQNNGPLLKNNKSKRRTHFYFFLAYSLIKARPMMLRMIWLVPSKI